METQDFDSSGTMSLKEFIDFAMKIEKPSAKQNEVRSNLRRPRTVVLDKITRDSSNQMVTQKLAATGRSGRPQKPRSCSFPGCGRVLSTPQSLKQHMLQHTGEQPFECGFAGCSFRCRNPANLNNHRELHLDPRDRPRYYCNQPGCFKVYMQRSSLRDHLRGHRDHRPHVCTYPGCGLSFRQSIHLKEHALVHLKKHERPSYPCLHPGCSSVLLSERSLRVHSYKHTGEYPFFCEYPGCGKGCATNTEYRNHLKVHINRTTGMSKLDSCFQCSIPNCHQSFADRHSLKLHVQASHPECLIACGFPGCERMYFNKQALVAHRRHHREKLDVSSTCPNSPESPDSSATVPMLSEFTDDPNEFVLGPAFDAVKPEPE
ncbi:zinc finger, C2H2 type [Opisthorchis viverrini]|uniref:Uncharacterized protein n=2 Tax=Opisthorchis viverrini TaxID=6198 RepID=A0A074ZNG4_OPIVI|nr:hypothetical protein T265_04591 [Opisthorchis viverrini]KER28641.1 hypothetical protein T265_04591 [Opisthorchis viverrini]OON22413.1 zinc finger, C2H2 type [Opisthorchis viverrini]